MREARNGANAIAFIGCCQPKPKRMQSIRMCVAGIVCLVKLKWTPEFMFPVRKPLEISSGNWYFRFFFFQWPPSNKKWSRFCELRSLAPCVVIESIGAERNLTLWRLGDLWIIRWFIEAHVNLLSTKSKSIFSPWQRVRFFLPLLRVR